MSRLFLQCLATGFLAAGLAIPASAEILTSDWQSVAGGRVRVIAEAPSADGAIRGGLEIDLEPGWKTYWKNPGPAGVPPQMELDGSRNIESHEILFPPPERVEDAYSVWAGYTRPVILPVQFRQLRPGEPTLLQASVFLGICETICIPFQADYSIDFADVKAGEAAGTTSIDIAYASLPAKASKDLNVKSATLSPDAKSIDVTIEAASQPPSVFAWTPAGSAVGMAEHLGKGETPRTHLYRVPVWDWPEGGTALEITLVDGPAAVQETVDVELSRSAVGQ